MKYSRQAAAVFLVLTVLWSCVIWSFSLDNAEQSAAESNRVSGFLSEIVEKVLGEQVELTQHTVRKTAHFAEFAVLGTLLFMTVYLFGVKRVNKMYFIGLPASTAVASIDECLQLFSDGRSAQISDVLLDLTGAMFAFSVCVIIIRLTVRLRQGKNHE
ncbi:MAG: VanZ family protein [Clostridia bacterium]|nr:VanZ family protein [Clostridia bacterium]